MSILNFKTLAFLAFAAGLLLFGGSPNSGYAQVLDNDFEEVEETNGFVQTNDVEEEFVEEEKCPPIEEEFEEIDDFENEEIPEEETEFRRW